jgi:hypothetical protein
MGQPFEWMERVVLMLGVGLLGGYMAAFALLAL